MTPAGIVGTATQTGNWQSSLGQLAVNDSDEGRRRQSESALRKGHKLTGEKGASSETVACKGNNVRVSIVARQPRQPTALACDELVVQCCEDGG